MVWVKINYRLRLGVSEEKAKDLLDTYHDKCAFCKTINLSSVMQ